MTITETEILRSVRDVLRTCGWLVIRMQQSMGSYKGVADLYCIRDGRDVWLEIKKPKGTQSIYQVQFEIDIKAQGGEYYVIKSIDDLQYYGLIEGLIF